MDSIDTTPPSPTCLEFDLATGQTRTVILAAIPALPTPAPPAPTLTRRQLRLMLLSLHLDESEVAAAIAAISDPVARQTAKIEWEDALTYHCDHPLVIQIGAALGLNREQIDAAFMEAALL